MGALGCGIATALAMWAMLLGMLFLVRMDSAYHGYGLFQQWVWPRWQELRSLLILGLPIGVSLFLESAIFATVALLLGRLGAVATAAYQIALNLAGMVFMIPLGLSMATTVRVGHAVGAGNVQVARLRGWVGIAISGLVMGIIGILIFLNRHAIARLYTDDIAVAMVAASLLRLAALFQVSDGLQVAALGALRGFKDTRLPLVIVIIAYWLLAFPLACLGIYLGLGPSGPWLGLVVGLTVAAILLNLRFWWLSSRLE